MMSLRHQDVREKKSYGLQPTDEESASLFPPSISDV
jgi:hypothetical protein